MPLSRVPVVITAAVLAAAGLVGVTSANAGAVCDVSDVSLTDASGTTDLRNTTACADTWYVVNPDNSRGDEYTVTRVRDAASKVYRVVVAPVGSAAFSEAQTFGVTVTTSTDSVRVASGRADFVDVGLSVPGVAQFKAQPVTVTVCAPEGDPACATTTDVRLEADLSFDTQYTDITAAKWSAPVQQYTLAASCPKTNGSGDALGVTISLQGPESTESSTPNLVDSLLVLPKTVTNSCFDVDADAFGVGVVVVADGLRIAVASSPSGAAQYGLEDPTDCGGACIALSQVGFTGGAEHRYLVGYAYKTQTATAWARSYLKKSSTKAAGVTKRNTKNWTITLKAGSSPACVQNGNAVSALRTSAMGAHVGCKYTMSYQRKTGKGWKTKRVGGSFVA